MKIKTVLFIVLLAFLCFPITRTQAGSFTDDFNDGNADGWIFPYYPDQTQFPGGSWSVDDGVLVQRWTGDNNRALVDKLLLSSQVIETHVTNFGYAGVVLWHQENHQSWVAINLNPVVA